MGVMACDRKGCDNIMCDKYSSDYGYICHECFEELSSFLPMKIETFMSTPKRRYKEIPVSVEELEEIFPTCGR